ncbi:MAG TPA: RNase H family protein [Pirellulales bacterium]|nr:RNase H family protein [Pirellulales bacterium]
MSVPAPHFLLLADARRRNDREEWRFVLQAADGSATLEAHDCEPEEKGQRLELLSVVRGLEALEQPSRVTLVTGSKYVRQGISQGLDEWKRDNWTWESFGEMAPVKNRDLWQRVDRALAFHQLEVRSIRIDGPHSGAADPAVSEPARAPSNEPAIERQAPPIARPHSLAAQKRAPAASAMPASRSPAPITARKKRRRSPPNTSRRFRLGGLRLRRWGRRSLENVRLALAQFGTDLLPPAWLD